jgi:hypothetical protein
MYSTMYNIMALARNLYFYGDTRVPSVSIVVDLRVAMSVTENQQWVPFALFSIYKIILLLSTI